MSNDKADATYHPGPPPRRTQLVVSVISINPDDAETYPDALAVLVLLPGGKAATVIHPSMPDSLFALSLRDLADRIAHRLEES